MNVGRGNSGTRGVRLCRGIFQVDSSLAFLLLVPLSHLSHCPTNGTFGTVGHLGHFLFKSKFLDDTLNCGLAYA